MSPISLLFDSSQFPESLIKELQFCLLNRCFNHKFHYGSFRQVAAWQRVHEAYCPARIETEVKNSYLKLFQNTVAINNIQHVTSLGCGSAKKDVELLQLISGTSLHYTAVDVGSAMLLTALNTVQTQFPYLETTGIVADMAKSQNLPRLIRSNRERPILFLCFGIIPNFEPFDFIQLLKRLLQTEEICLLSVNLAPGDDYENGIKNVFSQYDNLLTKEWLSILPADLGFSIKPEEIIFSIKECPQVPSLRRIQADWYLSRDTTVWVNEKSFTFGAGESIQLFYSYRYTPQKLSELLKGAHMKIVESQTSASGEEGIFAIKRVAI